MCPRDVNEKEESFHIREIQRAKVKEGKHEGFSHIHKVQTLLSARSVLLQASTACSRNQVRMRALETFIYYLSRSVFLKAAIALVEGLRVNSHFH